MARFVIRFDFRAPDFGAPTAELYPAAVEMAAWADRLDVEAIVLSEHHAADDGYLSAPLALAGALLGATTRAPVSIQALLVPLHDPVRLAEDIGALDLVSRGRLSVVAGLGYRPEEYELFGVPWKGRGALMEEKLRVMVQAWTGEPFEYRGTTVRVTPRPFSRPHPSCSSGVRPRSPPAAPAVSASASSRPSTTRSSGRGSRRSRGPTGSSPGCASCRRPTSPT